MAELLYDVVNPRGAWVDGNLLALGSTIALSDSAAKYLVQNGFLKLSAGQVPNLLPIGPQADDTVYFMVRRGSQTYYVRAGSLVDRLADLLGAPVTPVQAELLGAALFLGLL